MNALSSVLNLQDVFLKLPGLERPILQSIQFSVYPGDCIILLGGNGSGKSSLMKLIQRHYLTTEGKILFKQKALEEWNQAKLAKALITLNQDLSTSLFYDLTVLENCMIWALREGSVSWQISTKRENLFYREYLASYHTHLPEKLETPVRLLSGGEKQALLLALCLRYPPQLLLLDEHTSALDPVQAERIMARTHKALKTHQVTSIITTHNLDHALKYGNRLLAIREGKIVFSADKNKKETLTRSDLLEFCY
jgi:putative ABC transport system ATP-binding protein